VSKKKKTRVAKSGPVWRKTAEQATLDQMPKYNAFACGTGAHGDAKYNRAKQKRAWQSEMRKEGTRGSLLRFLETNRSVEALCTFTTKLDNQFRNRNRSEGGVAATVKNLVPAMAIPTCASRRTCRRGWPHALTPLAKIWMHWWSF